MLQSYHATLLCFLFQIGHCHSRTWTEIFQMSAIFFQNRLYIKALPIRRRGPTRPVLRIKAISTMWPRCNCFSTSSDNFTGPDSDNKESRLSVDDSDTSATSIPIVPRSSRLSSIIRDGVTLLNQSAATIQSNTQTKKSLFTSPEEKLESNPKLLAEEHRIFETAKNCLEDLCTKDSSFPLMAGDEPILLLGVRVNSSFTHADLYWSLPYTVLSTKELNDSQLDFLKNKMRERVNGEAGRTLLHRMNCALSNYYPPKIRFKEAPPVLLYRVLHDLGVN